MFKKDSVIGHLACLIAYSIFGFNIIVCKDLTSGGLISPLGIFTLRAIGAGGLFWLISLFLPSEKIDRKDLPKIFAASMLGFFTCQVTFLAGLPHITPMDCSIMSSLSPIYTMITPPKTMMAARTFCHVRVSIPIQMLMAMAMIGWT